MAINPETKYPGKIAPSSTEYPYGKARNITLPGDGTGTPWEAALVNDIFGFQQAVLTEAGITPSGNPEEVGASQYLEGLKRILLLPVGSVSEDFAGSFVADGLRVQAAGWLPDTQIGGGVFVGRSSLSKSLHDGGKYISPTVPAVSEQPGADLNAQIANFNAGNGETDPGGTGVYVRTDAILTPRAYGAQLDGAADDTAALASYDALTDDKGADLVNYTTNQTVAEALADAGGGPANLAADLDAIAESGAFYADGSTANRPDGLVGTVNSIYIDANTATQHFIGYEQNRALFRGRTGGVWGPWYEVTAQEIFSAGWPTIEGDNLLAEIDTTSTTGWTEGTNTNFSTDGASLTLTSTTSGGGTSTASAQRSVAMTASGDYILYLTVSGQTVAGSYVSIQLGGSGDGRVQFSLGYNWATGAEDQNRVSAAFRNAAGFTGIEGPVVDYSVPIEFAILYNDEFQSGTLYIKEAGAWVAYGVVEGIDVYRDIVRIYTGGDNNASITVDELFIAKPNIVSVGDSITEGATLYAPDPAEALTNYASTWQAYANLYPNVRNNIIVNKGVGSQDSAQIDSRMAGILTDATPQVVFLQASANDFGSGFTLSQRTVNIQNSIDKAVNAGAKVALLNAVYPNADASCFPGCGDFYREWWETQLGEIENANIKIDWMEGSGILSGGVYMDTTFTQPDGVHPNPAGHELLGDYIQSLEP